MGEGKGDAIHNINLGSPKRRKEDLREQNKTKLAGNQRVIGDQNCIALSKAAAFLAGIDAAIVILYHVAIILQIRPNVTRYR